jgi:hypothetical protein
MSLAFAKLANRFLGVEGFTSTNNTVSVNTLTFAKLANRLIGVDGFTSTNNTVSVNTDTLKETPKRVAGVAALISLSGLILLIAICAGSARLSYCYNIAIGNSGDLAALFAVICFFFPNFYYPYYALFLNPLCATQSRGITSGRRR